MNKPLKLSLVSLAVIVTLFLGAGAFILTLDPNDHKPWIADKFRTETGRELILGGEIGLTLYPWLSLILNDVQIGNAEGFGNEPMFAADNAVVRVKLIPLLRQHYEIDTVKLNGARLNLAVNADGRNNWSDLAGEAAAPSPAATAPSAGLPLGNIILGGVDVRGASLQFDDRAADVRYEINDLNFTTGELVYGAPIELALDLQFLASRPALSASANLTGTVLYDLDNGRYEITPLQLTSQLRGANLPNGRAEITLSTGLKVDLQADTLSLADLTLTALGSELQASVEGQNVTTANAVFQSSLRMVGSDLALLFKAAEIEPLASQLAGLTNRAFEFSTDVTVDGGRGTASIPVLNASLLGTTVSGAFQASAIQTSTPAVQGTLIAAGPDLPTVVEVVGQITGGRNSLLAQAGRDLRQVTNKSFAIDAEFDANLASGNVSVPRLDLRLLGATVDGNLVASNVQTDQPVVRGRLVAAGPDLPLLLQIAGYFQGTESALFQTAGKLTGLGNKAFTLNAEFDADLASGNISVPALTASSLGFQLSGNVSSRDFTARTGSMEGALTLSGQNLRGLLTALDQKDLGDVVQSLSLQVGLTGNRSALAVSPLKFDVVLSGANIPNSPVTLALDAGSRLNLDQETLTVDNFTVTGLGLNATGKLNATQLFDAPAANGEIAVADFNLRRLLQQLNQPVPEMADPNTLQRVSLGASFNGNQNYLNLSNLRVGLDETRLTGSVTVQNFSPLGLDFDLNVTELDADRYLATKAPQGAATQTTTTTTEIPVDLIRELRLNGQLVIDTLTLSGLHMSDLELGVNAEDGNLVLAPLSANLYEGNFSGTVGLNATGAVPRASIDANLQRVALEPLMTDFMGAAYISGRGNVQFTVSAQGMDTLALKRSLGGTGRIALEDGVLTGVDVAGVIGQVETILRSRRVAEVQRGQQTAFETFTATLAITNGVVASNDLLIKSPGIQITGRGTLVDLNTDAIGYNLVTSVDRSTATRDTVQYDIGGYSIPIACTGLISAPRCLPDTSEIVRTALANEVQRRVGDLLDRAIGTDTPTPPAADSTTTDPATPDPAAPTTPANPTDELINRALNRIFN